MNDAQTLDLTPGGGAVATLNERNLPMREATTVADAIMRMAMDTSVDLDRMERLIGIHRDMKKEEAKVAFIEAMSRMQPRLPSIDQNGRIVHGDGSAAKVIANYAKWEDINDAIKPVLAEFGFTLEFDVVQDDKSVTTKAIVEHVGGHSKSVSLRLGNDTSGNKSGVHSIASALSYGKRHSACALLNISSRLPGDADDDGRKAGADAMLTEEQVATLRQRIIDEDVDLPKFLEKLKVERLEDIFANRFDDVVRLLNSRRAAKEIKAKERATA